MSTTAEHLKARRDNDLRERLIARAEQLGVPNAQGWVESNLGQLVGSDIGGTTISDVYAFALGQYPTKRPGEDPAYVTDGHLEDAIVALRDTPTDG